MLYWPGIGIIDSSILGKNAKIIYEEKHIGGGPGRTVRMDGDGGLSPAQARR